MACYGQAVLPFAAKPLMIIGKLKAEQLTQTRSYSHSEKSELQCCCSVDVLDQTSYQLYIRNDDH